MAGKKRKSSSKSSSPRSTKKQAKSKPSSPATSSCTRSSPHTNTDKGPSNPVTVVKRIHPKKSPHDLNRYRILVLSNGLTVGLISQYRKQNPGILSTDHGLRQVFETIESGGHFLPSSKLNRNSHCNKYVPMLQCTPNLPSSTSFNDSCPLEETTGVAISVNVGGLDDPKDAQGLAHFTEHAVHYGTEKFPAENAVTLVLANFGVYNAYTTNNLTLYFSQVHNSMLDKSLELVSDMLTQPKFTRPLLDREVHAIDNEFQLRLPQWRKYLLIPHVSLRGNDHPLSRMICGSLETLADKGTRNTASDVACNKMRSNHNEKYVASAMTVAMTSKKGLDEMETIALKSFSNFLTGGHKTFKKTTVNVTRPPFLSSQRVYMIGLSSYRMLTLVWHLTPSQLGPKQERAVEYITRILSDTGEGGLLYDLNSKGLVCGVGVGSHSCKYTTILELSFIVIDSADSAVKHNNAEEIIQSVFAYLEFLAQVKEPEMKLLFEEMKIKDLFEFHYGDTSNNKSSMDASNDLATQLQVDEVNDDLLVEQTWRNSVFNYNRIQALCKQLRAGNPVMTVVETVPKNEQLPTNIGQPLTAPFSGVKYVAKSFQPPAVSQTQSNASGDSALRFQFIARNPLLIDDLVAKEKYLAKNPAHAFDEDKYLAPVNIGDVYPQPLAWKSEELKIKGVHLGHSSSSGISALVFINLASTICIQPNAMFETLCQLWKVALANMLTPYQSRLNGAGYHFGIVNKPCLGPSLVVHGRSRRLVEIVKFLLSKMFTGNISSEVFEIAKIQLGYMWESQLNDFFGLTEDIMATTMSHESSLSTDNGGILRTLTLANLTGYIARFNRSTFCSVILRGNIPPSDFNKIAEHLQRMQFTSGVDYCPEVFDSDERSLRTSFYVPGEKCVRVLNLASDNYLTVVTNYYLIGPDNDDETTDFFNTALSFMNCEASMCLRTQEQLGYLVFVRGYAPETLPKPALMFSITIAATASKHTACHIDQRIDDFLAKYSKCLHNMNDDIFRNKLKVACIPSTVRKEQVAEWFGRKFPSTFGVRDIKGKCIRAGIKKTSIQILTGNPDTKTKICSQDCKVCSSIGFGDEAWVQSSRCDSKLRFTKGRAYTKDYFVTSSRF